MFDFLFSKPHIDWVNKFKRRQEGAHHDFLQQYYAQGVPHANTPLNEVEFLAMDFETTGLSATTNDIVSIGIVPFTLDSICLKKSAYWLLRPRVRLSKKSVTIHGITHNDIIDSPDLTEIAPDLLKQMQNKIVVVHYRNMERNFLNQAFLHRYKEGIEFPVIDTMQLESIILHRSSLMLINLLKGNAAKSVRLAQTRQRYHLPFYTAHHALCDAVATAELFQAQVAYHFNADDRISKFWL